MKAANDEESLDRDKPDVVVKAGSVEVLDNAGHWLEGYLGLRIRDSHFTFWLRMVLGLPLCHQLPYSSTKEDNS